MKHYTSSCLFIVLACTAPAQIIRFEDPEELAHSQINEAFWGLWRQRSLAFRINVNERASFLSQRNGTISGWVVFDSLTQRDVLKLDISEYSGGVAEKQILLRRIVADGSKFLVYDPKSNTYTVTNYAGPNRTRQFYSLIDKVAGDGPLLLFSRLADQVYSGPQPRFRNWLPGSYLQPAGKKESNIFMIQPFPGGGERSIMLMNPLVGVIYTHRLSQNLNGPQTTWNLSLNWNQGGFGKFDFVPPMNAKQVGS